MTRDDIATAVYARFAGETLASVLRTAPDVSVTSPKQQARLAAARESLAEEAVKWADALLQELPATDGKA